MSSKKKVGKAVKAGGPWRTYSMEEIARHNRDDDVWLVIHGCVYDCSTFLNDHPGGPEILQQHAGTDVTSDFEEVFHSPDARKQLEDFIVGTLEGYTGDLDAVHKVGKKGYKTSDTQANQSSSLFYLIPILVFGAFLLYEFVL